MVVRVVFLGGVKMGMFLTPIVGSATATRSPASIASIGVLPLIAILLASCGGASIESSCPGAKSAQQELALINAARAAPRLCGTVAFPAVPPLTWHAQLESAAIAHSRDMATRNFFGHTNPDGLTSVQRIVSAGYSPFTWAGENIAAGYDSSEAVLQGWLTSPGHCENIMRADYIHFAVACATNPNSDYGTYWTQTFGAR